MGPGGVALAVALAIAACGRFGYDGADGPGAGSVDAGPTRCVGSCACPEGATCTFACPPGTSCTLDCGRNATCLLDCGGVCGGCGLTCGVGADCALDCNGDDLPCSATGGGVTMTCNVTPPPCGCTVMPGP